MDGFRCSLEKEFSSIYVFNLRGGIKGLSGELAKKEGQNVFDIMTGVSITLLVKNPNKTNKKAEIFYHDIGDYLNRKEKTEIISNFISIKNDNIKWFKIEPNENNDWLEQRNDVFGTYIPLEPIKKFDLKSQSFFNAYAIGVATNRDAWVYNFSKAKIEINMKKFISYYNEQQAGYGNEKLNNSKISIDNFLDTNPTKISWTVNLKKDIEKGKSHNLNVKKFRKSNYRPFCKQVIYFDKSFIERPGLSPILFPAPELSNLVICVTGTGDRRGFASLISSSIPNLDSLEKTQCFPLYYYEENTSAQKGLFDTGTEGDYIRRDGVSDFILERAKIQYGKNVTKEDVFYYVYGFLHSPEYRETFANDLKKMLPRLPLVEEVKDFWAFSKAGRKLADLHLNYETVPAYDGITVKQPDVIFQMTPQEMYRVTKMRFPKKDQKDTIIYNGIFTIQNIPAKAYEYVVNGKSAIEWIMERYAVSVHKDSGITNDPNDWSLETGKPSYIYDLLLSVINVSVQTVEIVEGLPKVKFE
jgi:predicted helicase